MNAAIHVLPERALSPSQASTYIDCAARWFYGALGLPDPPTGALAVGRAVHAAIAATMYVRGDRHQEEPAEIFEVCRSTLEEEMQQAELREDESKDQLQAQAHAMVAAFLEHGGDVRPGLHEGRPAIERSFVGTIGTVKVRAIVDLIDAQGCITDFKTASKSPNGVTPDQQLQLTTYGMLTGIRATKLMTLTKTATPKLIRQSFTLDPAATQYATTLYSMVAEAMDAGLHLPHRGSNLCSRKYCAFWRRCEEEHGGTVKP